MGVCVGGCEWVGVSGCVCVWVGCVGVFVCGCVCVFECVWVCVGVFCMGVCVCMSVGVCVGVSQRCHIVHFRHQSFGFFFLQILCLFYEENNLNFDIINFG